MGYTTDDLARLGARRAERTSLLRGVRDGDVPVAHLARVASSAFLAATRLVKVLEVHPLLGKVAARRLVAELGLDERTTLGGVRPEQWSSLAARIDGSGGAQP